LLQQLYLLWEMRTWCGYLKLYGDLINCIDYYSYQFNQAMCL